jgi:hypothetical protein
MQTYFVFNKKQLFLYSLNIIALFTCVEILNLACYAIAVFNNNYFSYNQFLNTKENNI